MCRVSFAFFCFVFCFLGCLCPNVTINAIHIREVVERSYRIEYKNQEGSIVKAIVELKEGETYSAIPSQSFMKIAYAFQCKVGMRFVKGAFAKESQLFPNREVTGRYSNDGYEGRTVLSFQFVESGFAPKMHHFSLTFVDLKFTVGTYSNRTPEGELIYSTPITALFLLK